MKTFARIDNGTVAELLATEAPIETLFHPALQWLDVTGLGAAVGWLAGPAGLAPPPPAAVEPAAPAPTLAELQARLAALAAQVAALAGG